MRPDPDWSGDRSVGEFLQTRSSERDSTLVIERRERINVPRPQGYGNIVLKGEGF